MKKILFTLLFIGLAVNASAEAWMAKSNQWAGAVKIEGPEVTIHIEDITDENLCLIMKGDLKAGKASTNNIPIAQIKRKPFKVVPISNDAQVCYDGDITKVKWMTPYEMKVWEETLNSIEWVRVQ